MEGDEVLGVLEVAELTRQSERRVRRALVAGVLKGAPSRPGQDGAVLRADAIQWLRDGAQDKKDGE